MNTNNGTLVLSGGTSQTVASNLVDTGTLTIGSGSTLTLGGTATAYNQTGGTTTLDGTLAASAVSISGGTAQGGGTWKGNVSLSGGILNVGDAGKAGLMKITGTYSQLSGSSLNVSIGGATAGTQFSQLQITGSASLAGTLTAALVNGFTPTVGQSFTVLTAGSRTGTFTNSTIAISPTLHFVISYTGTTVVLTVASGPSAATTNRLATPVAIANTKQNPSPVRPPVTVSFRGTGGVPVRLGKRVFVTGLNTPAAGLKSYAAYALESNVGTSRLAQIVSGWNRIERPVQVTRIASENLMRPQAPMHTGHVIGTGATRLAQTPRMDLSTRRQPMPLKILPMHVPVMAQ